MAAEARTAIEMERKRIVVDWDRGLGLWSRR